MDVGNGVTIYKTSRHATRKAKRSINKQNEGRTGYSKGVHVEYDLNCTYKTYNCFYVYTCKPNSMGDYECSQDAHFLDYTGLCCYPIC